jgi:mRNA-degrading endonuclease HigB of HigAB toxin-antitoxin module
MKNLKRVLGLILVWCMVMSSGVFDVRAYAATLGERLAQPETGWTRIDDRDANINYVGKWRQPDRKEFYNSTDTESVGTDASVQFNFTGTKLRLIGIIFYGTATTNVKVKIDGQEVGVFSQRKSGTVFSSLDFEIMDLKDAEHFVDITSGDIDYTVDAIDIAEGKSILPYNENVNKTPQLNILPKTKTVNVGEEFTTEVVVNNVYNIFAEDLKLSYDTKLFDYVGYENVTGLKVYKENHDSATGTLRFIVASQGKSNPINENGTIVKLKFKAKAVGEGKVDATAGRIADITTETDIATEDCGEALITVKGYQDVNKSGEFSLVDLAIDGYYFGELASNTDKTKYDADVVIDNNIDDKDLSAIVNQILVNKNYKPNM